MNRYIYLIAPAVMLAIFTLIFVLFSDNKAKTHKEYAPVEQVAAQPERQLVEKGKWEPMNYDSARQDQVSVWVYTLDDKRYLYVVNKTGNSMLEIK